MHKTFLSGFVPRVIHRLFQKDTIIGSLASLEEVTCSILQVLT
jgi:hypothetical protein